MTVLVTYASRHGATGEIAEHIAATLRLGGHEVEVGPVKEAGDLARYDAFVVGSAVYFGSWRKEATEFVRRNCSLLADRPVWLFSSGPLGAERADEEGQDLREAAEPKQLEELMALVCPQDHQVFFGVLDRSKLGFTERLIAALPAGRKLFPEGDFRDWENIEAWASSIARTLTTMPVAAG